MTSKEKKEKANCPVCLNHFTLVIRQPITCSFCPHATCRQCTSQYLLTSLNDPHCMECKREWNREFIDTHLTQTFRKGPLKLHRRRVLMDRERGRLPAMQVFVQAQITLTSGAEQIAKIRIERKRLKAERNRLQIELANEGFEALTKALQPISKDLAENKLKIRTLERDMGKARLVLLGHEKPEVRQFIMKCPAEECRGFLSSAWKCGTCDKFFCADCHAVKQGMRDEEHVCNADAKATAAMIRQETKPCPKCGIRISKIDGCDQMWCTECHTTFSWDSGQILLNTVVHNPHYYEYLRKTNGGVVPREAGDVPCGGLPNPYQFTMYINRSLVIPQDIKMQLNNIHRGLNDILHVRMPQFPLRQNANINRDFDILYLMNKITEEEWGTKLEQAETRFERRKEIGLILQTLVHIGSEKLTGIMNARPGQEKAIMMKTVAEMEEVRCYINNALIQKGIQMGIVVPEIDKTYYYRWVTKDKIKQEKEKAVNTIVYPGEQKEDDEDEIEIEESIVEEKKNTVMVEIEGEFVELPADALNK